jgi:two-component system chemotaxis sensor kinase CheA
MMLRKGDSISKEPFVIVAEHIEGFVGIMVDDLLGDGEIMVRDLDPYIKRYQPQGLMGNTIIKDGPDMVQTHGVEQQKDTEA